MLFFSPFLFFTHKNVLYLAKKRQNSLFFDGFASFIKLLRWVFFWCQKSLWTLFFNWFLNDLAFILFLLSRKNGSWSTKMLQLCPKSCWELQLTSGIWSYSYWSCTAFIWFWSMAIQARCQYYSMKDDEKENDSIRTNI